MKTLMPSLFVIGLSLSVFWFKAQVIGRVVIAIVRAWNKPVVDKRDANRFDY